MNRITTTAILTLIGALVLAGSAAASPPSVVDQYTEQPPTPGGQVPGSGGNGGNLDDPGGSNGENVQNGENSQEGGSGVGGQTGGGSGSGSLPSGSSSGEGSGSDPSGTSNGQAAGSESSLNPGQVSTQGASAPSPSDDGLGLIFPIALIMLLGGAAFVVLRQRSARSA